MTTTPVSLPPEIRAYLARYESRLLTPARTGAVLPEIRALVAAVPPNSVQDAKVLASSCCRLVADVSDGEVRGLEDVLTEVEIARWSHVQKAAGMAHGTLANHLGRLECLLRVRNGLPGRIARRGQQRLPEPPYGPAEVEALLAASRDAGTGAYASVLVLLGAGIAVPEVNGCQLIAEGHGPHVVRPTGERRAVLATIAQVAAPLPSTTVVEGDWAKARQACEAAGIELCTSRGRQTWRIGVLDPARPVAEVLREAGLGAKALDDARPFLPSLEEAVIASLLRG